MYDLKEIYYVYFICFPNTKIPFYIGKGKDDRWSTHLKETEDQTENLYKWRTIQQIYKQGNKPNIFLYSENINEETAYDIEEEMIAIYGRKRYDQGGILTNLCEGRRPPKMFGRSPPNKGKTLEELYGEERAKYIKSQMSQPGTQNPFYGKTHTLENIEKFRKNASIQWKGYKKNPEHIRKIEESRKNNPKEQKRLKKLALKNVHSEKMKAGAQKSNKRRGFEKTKNRVLKDYEKYQKIIEMLKKGFHRLEIRDQLNFDRVEIWKIEKRIEYFKNIIQSIEEDKINGRKSFKN